MSHQLKIKIQNSLTQYSNSVPKYGILYKKKYQTFKAMKFGVLFLLKNEAPVSISI